MAKAIIAGSRASTLALAQSRLVIAALENRFPDQIFEIKNISTRGDRVLDRSLSEIGGKGVFVKEIEEALLAGQIDLAVHSCKDLPTEQPAGLAIGAILEREDPRDVLVSREGRPLADLAAGARVGTSSPRRAAQLKAMRPDLQVADIRGNVDTRLRKLDEGQYDAIVLAAAGLSRLGLSDRACEFLDPAVFLPAPAQGALAVETRASDARTGALVASLDHFATRLVVDAERAFLRALGGGCSLPMGAYATVSGDSLAVSGVLADGGRLLRSTAQGPAAAAAQLGAQAATDVIGQRDAAA